MVNQRVLQSIEVRVHHSVWNEFTTVGDLFMEMLDARDVIEAYHQYIDTYEASLGVIRAKCKDDNSTFGEFAAKSQLKCDNHSLSSLLVSPIQRIPRYQLLIADLIKNTPDSHEDKALLQTAYSKMISFANSLNETKWSVEAQDRLRAIINKFQTSDRSDLNVRGRELIAEV
jgi:hypothetical protein